MAGRSAHPTSSSTDHPNDPSVEAAYLAAAPTQVAEILDGALHTMPRPGPRHARAATRLARQLGPFDDEPGDPGGWVLLVEPEVHLGPRPDKIVPDLAGWRRERLSSSVFEVEGPAALTTAPDWVCEVLSERTERVDRGKKMRIYRRERVGHVWLLSPTLETLEVYRFESGHWVVVDTFEGDAVARVEPFEAIELRLSVPWAR